MEFAMELAIAAATEAAMKPAMKAASAFATKFALLRLPPRERPLHLATHARASPFRPANSTNAGQNTAHPTGCAAAPFPRHL